MKNCNMLSPVTGEKSEVYDIFVKISKEGYIPNPDEQLSSQELYSYILSPEFTKDFGDWQNETNPELSKRTLASGEPNIFWDKDNKGYFYYNKYDSLTPFPPNLKGLNEFFDSKDITSIVHRLGYIAFKKHFGEDFTAKDVLSNTDFNLLKIVRQYFDDYIASGKDEFGNVEVLKEYEDEINKRIKGYYEELGLIYNERLENFDENVEEKDSRELIRKPSIERSSKDNVTANVKLLLSFLPTKEVDSIFNEKKFVPWSEVHNFLQTQLADISPEIQDGIEQDKFKIIIEIITNLATTKPYLNTLVEMLNHPNFTQTRKSEFLQAFDLTSVNLYVSEIKKINKSVLTHTTKNVSKVNSKDKVVLNEWGLNFKDIFIDDTGADTDRLAAIKARVEAIRGIKEGKSILHEILFDLGIELDIKSYDFFLNSNDFSTEISESDRIDLFVRAKQGVIRLIDGVTNGSIVTYKNKIFFNPLKSDNIFAQMAVADSFFFDDVSENVVFSGGKNKWIYSNPTYISRVLNSFKASRNTVKNKFYEPFNRSSRILRYLLAEDTDFFTEEARETESERRIANTEMGIFNVLQQEGESTSAVNNQDIKYIDAITDSISKTLAWRVKGKKTYTQTPTPAEKSTKIEISYGDAASAGSHLDSGLRFKDNQMVFNDEVDEIFYQYYKSEYERMGRAYEDLGSKDFSELIIYYHTDSNNNIMDENGKLVGNAFKSQIFPSLSENLPSLDLFDDTGKPIYNDLDSVKDKLKPIINKLIQDKVKDTARELLDIGVIKNDKVHGAILSNIDFAIAEQYYNLTSAPHIHVAADYTINGLINQIEYTKIFSGDPAYYKNMDDYKKRVPGTYTDGLYLHTGISDGDGIFNVASMENVITEGYDIKSLPADIRGYYKDINVTDAQGYITPQRWQFIMERLGKWSPDHAALFEKMMGRDLEPITNKQFKAAAQSLKGVYFDIVDGRPVYLKYSQVVLFPQLVKGSELENAYDKMTKNAKGEELTYNEQIHELVVLDGIKVGSNIPNSWDAGEFSTMQLYNKGWKLQQDLPTKGFDQIAVGTQIQKVLLAGLAFNLDKDFGGTDGATLYKELQDVISSLSNIGVKTFKQKLDIGRDNVIKNPKAYYKLLINELTRRGGEDNLIEALRKNLSPYAIPQAKNKLMNIFNSILLKETVKVKTNGGSFIQVSDFGLSKGRSKDRGIKWFINPETGLKRPRIENVEITRKDGTTAIVKRQRPGQILLPASFISASIPNYAELTSTEILERIDPKILENIVGYRIPNQGMSSNDALEIVGILPEGMGDSVVAYSEITMKTGSDFDIDKMYIMMPNFVDNDGKLEYVAYDKTKKPHEQNKTALQNRLIEIYGSILNSPDNFEDVMRPVDAIEIKNNINYLSEQSPAKDLDSFDLLKQIQLKFEFMGGQAGVAQVANYLMDHARGGFAQQTLHNYNIGWGHKTKDGESILDEEYSEKIPGHKPMKIMHTLSSLLNAFVDIAKDNYIVRGNYNTLTTNTALMMIRAGVHPYTVNAFLAQPIIKDYVTKKYASEGLSVEYVEPIGATILEYFSGNKEDLKLPDVSKFSYKKFVKELEAPSAANQVAILEKFLELQAISVVVNESVQSAGFDVDGPGKNLTHRQIAENKVLNVLENINEGVKGSVKGYEQKFHSTKAGIVETSFSTYYKNSVHLLKDLAKANPRLFLMGSEGIENTFNSVSRELGKGSLTNNLIGDVLNNSMYTYLISGFKPLKVSSMDDLLYGLKEELQDYKKNNKNNFFTNKLEIKNNKDFDFIGVNNRYKPKSYKDEMYRGWKDLWEANPSLGERLIKYSFHQSGFQNNMSQIFTYIPHEFFVVNFLDNFIIEKTFELNDNILDNFKDQMYRHNWYNSKIVPQVRDKQIIGNSTQVIFTMKNPGKSPKFQLYQDELYELQGYSKEDAGIYFVTHKLGYKSKNGSLYEYDSDSIITNSQFEENHLYDEELLANEKKQIKVHYKEFREPDIDEVDINAFLKRTAVPITKIDITKLPDCL